MSDISTTQIIFGIIAAIALGIWTAFIYWHRHQQEVEKTCRERWPELKPFHNATQDMLVVAVAVLTDSAIVGPEDFHARNKRWQRLYSDKRGRFGPRGRRRGTNLASLLDQVSLRLADPEWCEQFGISDAKLEVSLLRVSLSVRRDANYFVR